MASGIYDKARQKFLNASPILYVTNATNATPIVITTSTAHGLANGDDVFITGVGGNTAANSAAGAWNITVLSTTTFELDTSVGNGAYTSGGEVLLSDALVKKNPNIIRWTRDDIKVCIVDTNDYTHNIATNEFLSDVSAGIIDTSTVLLSKTATDGIADADDIIVTTVAGDQSEAVIIFKDTGTAATSPLIAYFDSGASANLPFTPNGGDVTITFSNGSNKIFKL